VKISQRQIQCTAATVTLKQLYKGALMNQTPTRISQDTKHAVEILKRGGLVALPTETVYGLAADASSADAVKKIFEAKGRPSDHPLIVHIAQAEAMEQWAKNIPDAAYKLAEAFWPGALTLILEKHSHVPKEVTGGLDTVALRVPNHPLTLQILEAFGGGVAAPSANRYGKVSPTSAQDVYEELDERVDLIIDGGRCEVGIESTIVDMCDGAAKVLRPGAITQEQINAVLGKSETKRDSAKLTPLKRHSGDKPSHYAPNAKVILCADENFEELLEECQDRSSHIGILTPKIPKNADTNLTWLELGEDMHTQAQRLYWALREADRLGLEVVLAFMPKDAGIGRALRDRLKRAAK